MSRAINQPLWDSWRVRFQQQRDSGLSVAAFCAEQNCAVATFYEWKRKLAACAEGVTPMAPERPTPQKRSRPDAGQESAFVRVALPQPTVASPWIEVTLGNGTLVRLPAQNLAALELVLRTMQPSA